MTTNEIKQAIATANTGKRWSANYLTAAEVEQMAAEVEAAGGEFTNAKAFERWQAQGVTSAVVKSMAVSGVSEAVVMYSAEMFRHYGEAVRFGVEARECITIDGRPYSVAWSADGKKTHGLFTYDAPATREAEYHRWNFNEPAPQKIGKATAKKLREWAAWLDRREAAAAAWLAKGKSEVDNLIARLDASGVEYVRRGDEITVHNGLLKMTISATPAMVYCNRPEVDQRRLYTAADGLNVNGALSGYLDLMLNLKMQY